MNWVEVGDGFIINLEEVVAIEKEGEYTTTVYSSAKESFAVPMAYETLKSIIMGRKSLENSFKRTMIKSSFTPTP